MSNPFRVFFSLFGSPGTGGSFKVSSAVGRGYRTLGPSDDGATFNVSVVDGERWETRTGCVYDEETRTLTRGTFESSSTGSAINLSSAALVMAEPLTATQLQSVQAAIAAGQLDVFAGSKLPTLAGVPVGSITLNAGSGNTVSALRLTFAPPTDTIGAQRLLVPTDETSVLAVGSTRSFTIDELAGQALVMHAVGVSSSTTYTGAAYVIGSAEADLADAMANDARLEWLSDDIARVDVTVEQGATAQTAIVSILGWTR